MALRNLTDEELIDDIRSMERALQQYKDEVERRVLEDAPPLRVLLTHPHDGHGPSDTCMDCSRPSDPDQP